MVQQSRVYLNGTVMSTSYPVSWRNERDRGSNISSRKAEIYITKDGYDALLPEINDAIILRRGPSTGTENIMYRGTINRITETNDKKVLLEIRDPLYYYQFDIIKAQSFDSDIDAEAGVVSAIAESIIDAGGQTSRVVSSTDYPIRKRFVIRMKSRYQVLRELAEYLNYNIYYDHVDDVIAFEPIGYEDYATNLQTGSGNNVLNNPVWSIDKTNMRNRIIVNGAFEYEWKTETFSPNGSTTIFTLDFEPGMTELDIDGTKKTRGVVNSTDSYDYYVKEEQRQIIFLSAPSGTTMTVNYEAKIPKSVEGANDESIDQYGEQAEAFDFKDIMDVDDAENRLTFLLSHLEWPSTSTKLHIQDINDIDVSHRIRVIDLKNNRDLWLNVMRITYTWPDPYDLLEVGEYDDTLPDVLANLNRRITALENLERQNTDLLTQVIGGTHYAELDNTGILNESVAAANYYDDGLLYDDGNNYDLGGESFSDTQIHQNIKVWSDDLKSTLWEDSSSTDATIDNTNGVISFDDGEIYQTNPVFKGFTPVDCRLQIPTSAISGTLEYAVSADNKTNFETVTRGSVHTFTNADGTGVVLRITASGSATLDLRTNDLNIPELISLEVDVS